MFNIYRGFCISIFLCLVGFITFLLATALFSYVDDKTHYYDEAKIESRMVGQ